MHENIESSIIDKPRSSCYSEYTVYNKYTQFKVNILSCGSMFRRREDYRHVRIHMDIIISNSSGDPIYEQIAAQIKAQILTGQLAAGEVLPSMRRLALELHISLITTKRAYAELEEQGFIETCAGRGCFVKAQNAQLVREEHLKQIEGLFEQALGRARLSGIPLAELQEMLELLYEERQRPLQ